MLFIARPVFCRVACVVTAGALLVVSACSSSVRFQEVDVSGAEVSSFTAGRPGSLTVDYERLLRQGSRNEALNGMEIGLAAFELGDFNAARDAFDEALARIETVYANDQTAKSARENRNFSVRAIDFKGHPYERAMAYYYRGLLYMKDGDYENARACFRSGVIQDTFVEEEQDRCDFALLIYLEGWASRCAGDEQLAAEAFAEAQSLRPDLIAPPPFHNLLLIAETGRAPRKVSDGVGHAKLRFFPGKNFKECHARFLLDGRSIVATPAESILYQASTRGSRPIDYILEDRVVYRQETVVIGTGLAEVGQGVVVLAPLLDGGGGAASAVGGTLGLFGVANMAAAQNAQSHADPRYWTNLPDTVHIATMAYSGGGAFAAEFSDDQGQVIAKLTQQGKLNSADGRFWLGWVRSRSAVEELHAAMRNPMITNER